jgi:hypothetical protein
MHVADLLSDPLRLCLALGPPAVYLIVLGWINLSHRPRVVSGGRDAAALGLALAGLVIIGPLELFFPHDAELRFGAYVWVMLAVLYGLCMVLMLLMLRPRLVVYNMSADQLRPLLGELVAKLDGDARWAGDTLSLPGLGILLHVETFAGLRNVALVSVGPHQSQMGWRRLETALAGAVGRLEIPRNLRGLLLAATGLLMLLGIGAAVYQQRDALGHQLAAVQDAMKSMLRLQ